MIPAIYLIYASLFTDADDAMAYGGGLMVVATLLMGGCTPAMILGWTRPDAEPDETELESS